MERQRNVLSYVFHSLTQNGNLIRQHCLLILEWAATLQLPALLQGCEYYCPSSPSGVSNLKNDQMKVSQVADFCTRSFYNIKTSSHSPCSWHKWEQAHYFLGQDIKSPPGPLPCLGNLLCAFQSLAHGLIFFGTPVSCCHHPPVLRSLQEAATSLEWQVLSSLLSLSLLVPLPSPWPRLFLAEEKVKHLSTSLPIA